MTVNNQKQNAHEIVIYKSRNKDIKFNFDTKTETVWATQAQIAELFDVNIPAISKHASNIFKVQELDKKSVVSKMEITAADGKKYLTTLYDLDMILAIGYRVNSARAVDFRRWASKVLKDFILRGVAINQERLDQLNQMLQIVSRSEIPEVSGVALVVKNYLGALNLLRKKMRAIS